MSMLKEFQEFALKGNVVDMAVGIIIGGAFGTIVASLVKDMIMPPIGLMLGGVDFSDIKIPLRAAGPGREAVTMNVGTFVNNVISFLIVAFAVFMLVKAVNELRKRFETEKPAAAPLRRLRPRCTSRKSATPSSRSERCRPVTGCPAGRGDRARRTPGAIGRSVVQLLQAPVAVGPAHLPKSSANRSRIGPRSQFFVVLCIHAPVCANAATLLRILALSRIGGRLSMMTRMMRRGSRPPALGSLVFAAAATLSAAISSPVSAAESPKRNLQICWSPDKLASGVAEDRIRTGGRIALWASPKGTPLPFKAIPKDERGAIRRVKLPAGLKLVALTFDLCEQPHEIAGYQGGIVDFLRANGIKATFFAGGKWMQTHKERTQQLMSDPLFEVGNHSWEHRNLRLLAGNSLLEEIEYAQLSYEQVRQELAAKQCIGPDGRRTPYESAPQRASLFRFPFGACNDRSLEAVAEMGLKVIQWDVTSGDPSPDQTPDLIVKKSSREGEARFHRHISRQWSRLAHTQRIAGDRRGAAG